MASSAEFRELETLILGVDKKVGDFSEKLDNVERSLKTMVNEVKADVNVLKVKCNTSITTSKSYAEILLSLNGGCRLWICKSRKLKTRNWKNRKLTSKNKLRVSLRKWSCSRNMRENKTFLFMVLTTVIKMRTYMP